MSSNKSVAAVKGAIGISDVIVTVVIVFVMIVSIDATLCCRQHSNHAPTCPYLL